MLDWVTSDLKKYNGPSATCLIRAVVFKSARASLFLISWYTAPSFPHIYSVQTPWYRMLNDTIFSLWCHRCIGKFVAERVELRWISLHTLLCLLLRTFLICYGSLDAYVFVGIIFITAFLFAFFLWLIGWVQLTAQNWCVWCCQSCDELSKIDIAEYLRLDAVHGYETLSMRP